MRSFLITVFFVFAFLLPLFFFALPDISNVHAQTPCYLTFSTSGSPTTYKPITVTVNDADPFSDYRVTLTGPGVNTAQDKHTGPFQTVGTVDFTFDGNSFPTAGTYTFDSKKIDSPTFDCSDPPSFEVKAKPTCSIKDNISLVDAGKKITVIGHELEEGFFSDGQAPKEVWLDPLAGDPAAYDTIPTDQNVVWSAIYKQWRGDIKIPESIVSGKYMVQVEIMHGVYIDCAEITVEGKPIPIEGRNPCVGNVCQTALGDIGATIKSFTGKILAIAIGLAGGIALILMVVGAIRVLTSTGNPQAVAGGREIFVAALVGLLFLIFSTVILRLLGYWVIGIK